MVEQLYPGRGQGQKQFTPEMEVELALEKSRQSRDSREWAVGDIREACGLTYGCEMQPILGDRARPCKVCILFCCS